MYTDSVKQKLTRQYTSIDYDPLIAQSSVILNNFNYSWHFNAKYRGVEEYSVSYINIDKLQMSLKGKEKNFKSWKRINEIKCKIHCKFLILRFKENY